MVERAETAERVVPAEVSDLLEERSRIQGWLESLAELEDEATPEVYARVRDDYASRLEDVGRRLATHQEDLEASLARHREGVQSLQAERDGRAGELEEAKLRFTVGEYDEEEWSRRRQACEGDLEELDARLAAERTAVDELTGVLGALAPTDSAGGSAALSASDPTGRVGEREVSPDIEPQPDELQPGTETRAGIAPEGEAEPERGPEQEADESPRAAAPASRSPSVADDADYLDELEFLESLSLEDAERFDAVSAMLEPKEQEEERRGGREGRR